MALSNRAVYFSLLVALLSLIPAFNARAHAQSNTPGQPLIATSGSSTTDGIFWDAKQFPGADICAQINAAWAAAMTTGVTSATIDARGITGPQRCAASPFPKKASGKLLLGNTVITTAVTWQVPTLTHVEGIGVSGLVASTTANTTIRAGSSSADPVLQLGSSKVHSFSVQVKDLTVDADGLATTGILNNSSYEGTTLEGVNIYNATLYGLLIGQYDAQHSGGGSGPYRNINIQYNNKCSTCGKNSTGILIETVLNQAGMPIRGLDNITVTGRGAAGESIGSCIAIVGWPVQITNSHVEFCTTGIQIGAPGKIKTSDVVIQNVSTDPFNGWNITITNATDVVLSAITGFGGRLIQDNVSNNQILGHGGINPIGFYLLGDGPNPAVISTAAKTSTGPLKWVAPGDLQVIGNLSKATGTFKIDDPRDPANKYLYHSFVESPDMMDVYNGSVTTDKHGWATVTLPDYFEALNGDFRYQLTAIGTFAQATVAKEIQNNRFTIRTSKPAVKVSWQVTGIRHDAYAKAHPIQVDEEKPPSERGHYLHPELFDSSEEQIAGEQPASK
ncbi:MAG TPA: hypothetical protein VNZ03_08860 [Terriglobales bacterium]|nr:hypothetical protein [Terriglobales bacterium]